MNIIPAIDLQDGRCVRLFQGDFDKSTEYSDDPAAVAGDFQAMGFEDLHIVDLDGAKLGRQKNRDIVSVIASNSELEMQLGGGIRDKETVSNWLAAGVSRCVIGSLAVDEPAIVRNWLQEFGPDRIVLALDVKLNENGTPMLVTHGWTRSVELNLWQCVDEFMQYNLKHVLCTDTSRDGTMAGPNVALYQEFVAHYPSIRLQASGGVRHADDLRRLDELGAGAAITGRALLDGKIKTEELGPFLRVA